MSGTDRSRRDYALLKKSHRALEAEQYDTAENSAPPAPPAPVGRREGKHNAPPVTPPPESAAADEAVMMYRGRPVRRGSGATPGAGSSRGKPSKFRGAGGGKPQRRPETAVGSTTDRVKQALATLSEMHDEGLITKAEYDAKRRQLLDRL